MEVEIPNTDYPPVHDQDFGTPKNANYVSKNDLKSLPTSRRVTVTTQDLTSPALNISYGLGMQASSRPRLYSQTTMAIPMQVDISETEDTQSDDVLSD